MLRGARLGSRDNETKGNTLPAAQKLLKCGLIGIFEIISCIQDKNDLFKY